MKGMGGSQEDLGFYTEDDGKLTEGVVKNDTLIL